MKRVLIFVVLALVLVFSLGGCLIGNPADGYAPPLCPGLGAVFGPVLVWAILRVVGKV